jgi:hypothetical protein
MPSFSKCSQETFICIRTLQNLEVIIRRLKIDSTLLDQRGEALAGDAAGEQCQHLDFVQRLAFFLGGLCQAGSGRREQDQGKEFDSHGASPPHGMPAFYTVVS